MSHAIRIAYRDRVAALFRVRAGEWIDGRELEAYGGRYAWRTRVSDCRRELDMDIRNRQRWVVVNDDDRKVKVSEYCYVTPARQRPLEF